MFYDEYKITDLELLKKLKQDVKKNTVDWYYKKTNIQGSMTSYKRYTLEAKKLFQPIQDKISDKYFILEAWGGLLRKGDYVAEHHHDPVVQTPNYPVNRSGILYLTDILPGTYFEKYDTTIVPEIGKMVIFDSSLKHKVNPSESDEERINIAWNGRIKENYEF
jgi:hypothetical protein